MSYLSERSVILENWMFFAPILLLVVTYFYMKENRRDDKNENSISANEKLNSLAESEYIGEYQEENAVSEEEYAPFLKDEEHIPFPGATITLDGGAAKFYDIANNRRSVRKYSRREVDFEVIRKCIHAAGKRTMNFSHFDRNVSLLLRHESQWCSHSAMDILCCTRSKNKTKNPSNY